MPRPHAKPFVAVLSALLALSLGVLLLPADAGAAAKLKTKIGWGPLKDRKAAKKVVKTKHEVRPDNHKANHTVVTKAQLKKFRRTSDMPYARYVDGKYKGTTDDIIEWAAYKWGLPEDVLRAVAVQETWWYQDFVGDNGDSFGIFQVRRPYHCCFPFTQTSTAFNADYYGGIIRAYYDGKQDWLNNPDIAPDNGRKYKPGDLWGSIGAWYSGRWHTEPNQGYVEGVKLNLRKRTWANHPYFDESK